MSAYTINVVSLALLTLSAGVGLKPIRSLVQTRGLNVQLLDAIKKRGAITATKPDPEALIVVKYPGRLLTSEAPATRVRELNDKMRVLHHMVETETNTG